MTDHLPTAPEPGDLIGPYRLRSVAGRGGMGTVYRAADTLLGDRDVAVKVMAVHLSGADAYRSAFLREAQVAAEVSHPHVVPVHSAGEWDGLLYLAMAWVDGEDLGRAAANGLGAQRAVAAVQQVAWALDALHEVGIVHGDVKPSNVILHRSGGNDHAYLVDFGVARRTDYADARTNELVGATPAYAAPELGEGAPDARTDQYALGCVLFELLTGEKPFGSGEPAVLAGRHRQPLRPRPSDLAAELAPFDEAIMRSLALDPADRFACGADFGRALELALRRLADAPTVVSPASAVPASGVPAHDVSPDDTDPLPGLPPLVSPPTAERPAPRRSGGRAVGLAALGALLAVAAAGAWLVLDDDRSAGDAAQRATEQRRADQRTVARLVGHYADALDRGDQALLAQVVSDDVVRRASEGTRVECVVDRGSAAALARWEAQLPRLAGYRLVGASASAVQVRGDVATLRASSGVGSQIPKPLRFRARLEDDGVWRLTEVVAPPCTL